MDFRPLHANELPALRRYVARNPFRLADNSLGFLLMWRPYAHTALAEAEGCLLLRTAYGGKIRFAYPIHPEADEAAETRALAAIEAWCVAEGVPLAIGSAPMERLPLLARRYGRDMVVENPRTWRDYLYNLADFVDYPGRRFAGQRNHLAKFRRAYPDATYRALTEADLPAAHAFLRVYAERQYAKNSFLAKEELHATETLLSMFGALGLSGGVLEHEGRIIALTVGETIGDTLMVHVEKALVGYEGIYPTIAHCFAEAMKPSGLLYINREDDAGDCGLRKSKLQYNPIRLVDKYAITPRRVIEALEAPPELHTERLAIRPVPDADVHAYGRLARDLARNRHWGWDWRTAWTGEGDPRDAWFLEIARTDFARRVELDLGLYLGETLVGECVFHNFTYDGAVEIGVRLLPEHEGHGYATEAMRTMADYALCHWGLERVVAKCYRENLASKKMLLASGLRPDREDETFFHFSRTAKN